ncbi:MAG: hypothetical protein EOO99_07520 [Pedobacter sp.]|nr:MAG: hypothetical protein EOO99_07520 [Pedobacter sp.]
MKFIVTALFAFYALCGFAQKTPFEKSQKKETTTYTEAISFYKQLAAKHPLQAKLFSYGATDFGEPLHLLVLSSDQTFDPKLIKQKNKRVLLINNGIHPGEPEGIDASMMWARDLLVKNALPKDVVIAIIPVYNIGGAFNRTSTSRANQNGPVAYGFRGNAKNYDLNRDFIKSDSKNSRTFQLIFNLWNPDVMVDTHTSNGSDYSYTMTLIPTQKDKLNPILSSYLTSKMLPELYAQMAAKGFEMTPYVNSMGETPDKGITGFLEYARYSTGYAALHNVIGFMPETHMLKDFDKRVEATYTLLQSYLNIVTRDAQLIGENKKKADAFTSAQQVFPLDWKLNREKIDSLTFKGYTAKQKPSLVSGQNRLYYDRTEPYQKRIPYLDSFEPSLTVNKPIAYIIPKAWTEVIALLKLNGVNTSTLKTDQKVALSMYYISDYKTVTRPFEGHYQHSGVVLETKAQEVQFYAGDVVVYTNQAKNRYILETLEPQAPDSFFNWNFFDAILGQKEHYSAYVFEDTAAELLKKDSLLKAKFEAEKLANPEGMKSARAQLDFIYKNSDYYEKTYMRYPIGRLENPAIKLNTF